MRWIVGIVEMAYSQTCLLGNPSHASISGIGGVSDWLVWKTGVALPRSWIPARNIVVFRANTASPSNSSAMIFRVPSGNHSSQICLATRAESDICTYRGSHCSPASRSVFPHREHACADSGNSSIDEYPARVIPTPYLPRLSIPPLSTVYQANQAIGVGITHAYRIQRLISAVPSS